MLSTATKAESDIKARLCLVLWQKETRCLRCSDNRVSRCGWDWQTLHVCSWLVLGNIWPQGHSLGTDPGLPQGRDGEEVPCILFPAEWLQWTFPACLLSHWSMPCLFKLIVTFYLSVHCQDTLICPESSSSFMWVSWCFKLFCSTDKQKLTNK